MFETTIRPILLDVALLLAVFAVALAFEKYFKRDKVYVPREIGLNLAAMVIDAFVLALVVMPLVLQLSAKITSLTPWPKLSLTSGSAALPLFIAATFVINDFFYYWFHRALHQVNFLWALHKFHHVEAEMNVTTASRIQLLEDAVQQFVVALPLGLLVDLSCIPNAVAMTIGILIFLQHIDLPLSWGRYSHVLSSPYYHRIHHSREVRHRDKNFAVVLPLWDILFGTHYHASQREFPHAGMPGNDPYYSHWIAFFVPKVVPAGIARVHVRLRDKLHARRKSPALHNADFRS